MPSTGRRVALNSLIFLLALCMILSGLSAAAGWRSNPARPIVDVVGINQNWAVFAPDPRLQTLDFEARVTLSDESVRVWKIPAGGPWVGAYRGYRWAKWVENVTVDANRDRLWLATARWAARQFDEPHRHPVRVALVRRWYEVAPPGQPEPVPPAWREYTYFVLNLGTASTTGAGR